MSNPTLTHNPLTTPTDPTPRKTADLPSIAACPPTHFLRHLYLLARWLERASLPRIRFDDLRHTNATLLLELGENPKVVQERLGHSQISLTLDTYSHVLPDMQQQAADKLDKLFGVV